MMKREFRVTLKDSGYNEEAFAFCVYDNAMKFVETALRASEKDMKAIIELIDDNTKEEE